MPSPTLRAVAAVSVAAAAALLAGCGAPEPAPTVTVTATHTVQAEVAEAAPQVCIDAIDAAVDLLEVEAEEAAALDEHFRSDAEMLKAAAGGAFDEEAAYDYIDTMSDALDAREAVTHKMRNSPLPRLVEECRRLT